MSAVIFIYSERCDIMEDLPSSCAGAAFRLLVPEPICYSVYNLLEHYDTGKILYEEQPDVIIACGPEARTCLQFDGVDGLIVAPDIAVPTWSAKECAKIGARVQRIHDGG